MAASPDHRPDSVYRPAPVAYLFADPGPAASLGSALVHGQADTGQASQTGGMGEGGDNLRRTAHPSLSGLRVLLAKHLGRRGLGARPRHLAPPLPRSLSPHASWSKLPTLGF